MTAYIDRVLKNPNNWLVYSTALLIRARLEALREKTADRASMQLNVLVDQFNDPETETSTLVRCAQNQVFSLLSIIINPVDV
jgi:hypothetical protein